MYSNPRAQLAARRRQEIAELHANGIPNRSSARLLGVAPKTVRRAISNPSQVPRRAERARSPLDGDAQQPSRRALDIEAGVVWRTLFGSTHSLWQAWHATRACRDGPDSFARHQLGFVSRLDGTWRTWPSAQRIAGDFVRPGSTRGGMPSYLVIVTRVWRQLRTTGTAYQPIVLYEKWAAAELHREIRQSWEDGRRPLIPEELQCDSVRRGGFEGAIPYLTGDANAPPIRIPRLADRGICVMHGYDLAEREAFFANAVTNDAVDPSLGVLVLASTDSVCVGSPIARVPRLECLATPVSGPARIQHGMLQLSEQEGERRPTSHTGAHHHSRAALITVLNWAINYQRDLVKPGMMSLVVAEGHAVLPELAAFITRWQAGSLAIAVALKPTGSDDEQALMTRANWGFAATPLSPAPPDHRVQPDTGMTARDYARLIKILTTV